MPTTTADAAPAPSPRLKELRHMCKVWQRRLRLLDWRLTLQMVPELTEGEQELWGRLESTPGVMEATIFIAAGIPPEAVEPTLVYELLHIRLQPFDEPDEQAKENAIDLIASTLLAAYPHRRPRPTTKEEGDQK